MSEYLVSVYNLELERKAVLTTFISLVWEEGYNSEGVFQLECVLSEDLMELFQPEWYCGLTGHDTLMVIKSIQVQDNRVVVNGFPATHIFADRVSVEEIYNVNAEEAMRSLFSSMDAYPCFELGDLSGLEDTFTAQTSDQTLQEYFETIAQACDYGFRMWHDSSNKKLLFEVYQGEENANARFSTNYGNLGDITYEHSTVDYKNVAIVAGEGEGDDRVTVYAGETEATGADRREMYVDARNEQQEDDETDAEYEESLIAYGEEKLLEQLETESISFTIDDDSVSLGDVVTCYLSEIGINLQARVTIIEEVYQENRVERNITVGTPVILRRY